MKTEVKEIPFNEGTLLGVRTEDGNVWLAVRTACRDIGLSEKQAENEVKKVKDSLLFENQWTELTLKFRGQVRKITVLSEKFVPMWLAQINLTPNMRKNNPEAVERLLKYQLEAADVLHKAFYVTEEQKERLHSELGLEGKIEDIQIQITDIREKLGEVVDNITLTTVQQGKLQRAVKNRINYLLGGAHSKAYREKSRMYFKNLWQQFCDVFECGSYKDLNPLHMRDDIATKWISEWEYVEE